MPINIVANGIPDIPKRKKTSVLETGDAAQTEDNEWSHEYDVVRFVFDS